MRRDSLFVSHLVAECEMKRFPFCFNKSVFEDLSDGKLVRGGSSRKTVRLSRRPRRHWRAAEHPLSGCQNLFLNHSQDAAWASVLGLSVTDAALSVPSPFRDAQTDPQMDFVSCFSRLSLIG